MSEQDSGFSAAMKPPKERSSIDLVDKCEDMMSSAYEFIRHFPRYQQQALGVDIRKTMTRLLHAVHRCARKFYKKTTLEDLIVEIDFLRSQVRTAYNAKYIDIKKYTKWAKMNDEIGRMIGGWHKKILARIEEDEARKQAEKRRGRTS